MSQNATEKTSDQRQIGFSDLQIPFATDTYFILPKTKANLNSFDEIKHTTLFHTTFYLQVEPYCFLNI